MSQTLLIGPSSSFFLLYSILLPFAKAQACIGPSESERIRQSNRDFPFLCLLRNVVAVKFFRWVPGSFQIQRWREDALRV